MKLQTIKNIYHALNAECFGNCLATPVIRLTRSNDLHGKVSDGGPRGPIMRIHPFSGSNEREMRSTVFHEMIHQYLDYHLDVEDNGHHGDLFWLAYFTFANGTFDWEKPGDYDDY